MSEEKNAVTKEQTTQHTTQQTTQQETQGPDLTVQDLQALKSIIDVASTRGAFRPNEMMTIGQVYTKLEQFLGAVAEQQEKTKEG